MLATAVQAPHLCADELDYRIVGLIGPINGEELVKRFSQGDTVKDRVIRGDDLIQIIEKTTHRIRIKNCLVEGCLDFNKLSTLPIEKIELPKSLHETNNPSWRVVSMVNNEIDVVNCIFKSDDTEKYLMKARHTIFYKKFAFRNVIFQGKISFDCAGFGSKVDFSSCRFADDTEFKTVFGQKATFSHSTFATLAKFEPGVFGDEVDFRGSTFSGPAYFTDSIFNKNVDFARATFGDEVDFKGAMFNGYAIFMDTTFDGTCWFYDTVFSDKTTFNGTTFGEVDFDRTRFLFDVDFDNAIFSSDAFFWDAIFRKTASFRFTSFKGPAQFRGSSFGKLDFLPRRVMEYADFRKTRIRMLNVNGDTFPVNFKGRLDFRASIISDVYFENVMFQNIVDFSDAKLGSVVEETQGNEDVAVVFKDITFDSECYLKGTNFCADTAFENVTFRKTADFTDAVFRFQKKRGKGRFVFSHVKFGAFKIKWKQLPNIECWATQDKERVKSVLEEESF